MKSCYALENQIRRRILRIACATALAVAFTVARLASADVAGRLAEEAVFLSSGDFYAAGVVARYGLVKEGLVRAGCACYTTEEEVDRLVEGVARLSARG